MSEELGRCCDGHHADCLGAQTIVPVGFGCFEAPSWCNTITLLIVTGKHSAPRCKVRLSSITDLLGGSSGFFSV